MSRAFKELGLDATPLAAATPAFCTSIPAGELRGICEQARARKARLVALWGSDETTRRAGHALHLALAFPAGLLWVSVPLSREDPHYPGIADIYPSANRMQRAAADLLGIIPSADADRRKWLRHGAWPEGAFPLRGILLELERIANHLGDLGYLGNDVSLSFGFFQFWRLREDLLRTHAQLFGHRYLMDAVVPGGVAKDLPPAAGEALAERLA